MISGRSVENSYRSGRVVKRHCYHRKSQMLHLHNSDNTTCAIRDQCQLVEKYEATLIVVF